MGSAFGSVEFVNVSLLSKYTKDQLFIVIVDCGNNVFFILSCVAHVSTWCTASLKMY